MQIIFDFRNKINWTLLVYLFSFSTVNSQTNLYSGFELIHLPYNSLTGVKMITGAEEQVNNNLFYFNLHLSYAIGNRNFKLNSESKYTLVNGSNRSDYPLPGILPGIDESVYIKSLQLKTAKTVDVGLSILYGRSIFIKVKNSLIATAGLNLSWVEEVSIVNSLKGDFTNFYGTINDVYLVTPYSQKYFDLGPQLGLIYIFNFKNKGSFGLKSEVTWLAHTGFNYSIGPFFRIKI